MKHSVDIIKRGDDPHPYLQGFVEFVNIHVNPETNPHGWRDELEQRFESLATDYAMQHGSEAEFHETEQGVTVTFNFTGNRFSSPLREVVESPQPGDFIRLDAEHHTTIGNGQISTTPSPQGDDRQLYTVQDTRGEMFTIARSPEDDTDERRGWKLAYPQSWSGQTQ